MKTGSHIGTCVLKHLHVATGQLPGTLVSNGLTPKKEQDNRLILGDKTSPWLHG